MKFNPFTGTLDITGGAAAPSPSSGYVGAPTVVRAGQTFTVPDDTQMLTKLPVVLEAGASIELGTNSAHVAL